RGGWRVEGRIVGSTRGRERARSSCRNGIRQVEPLCRGIVAAWFLPSFAYLVVIGSLGVTTKYALRTMSWEELILWTSAAYLAVGCALLAIGTPARFHGGLDGFLAGLTALIFPAAGILFSLALAHGPASRVVPVTSAYPLVTVLLSATFLAEGVTLLRIVGTLLVVAGLIVVSVR